jgi:hypothetical protein
MRMYQVSRAIYRELAADVQGGPVAHGHVLEACERTVRRLVEDWRYFARPSRTLFHDVRPWVDQAAWPRAWRVVDGYVTTLRAALERVPENGLDSEGGTVQCRATTRKGTPCQRVPLSRSGYCPSHQHLAETETEEGAASLAA